MNQNDDSYASWLSRKLATNSVSDSANHRLWTGAITAAGYGALSVNGRVLYVHRLAAHLYLAFDLASPMYVLHACDVPNCINPDHLFIGTHADNMQDAAAKKRMGRGKLTPDGVREIRRLVSEGWRYQDIAKR